MTTMDPRDPFEPGELEVLARWRIDAAPGDLLDRALARRTRARRRLALAGAALAAGLAAVALISRTGGGGGVLHAEERVSLPLLGRGVLVAEPGTRLTWQVDPTGAARVEQASGRVFYRVEPGGPFRVITGAGELSVLGTCFEVEVLSVKTTTAGVAGGALGAALATAVVVTVYEGKVASSSPGGETVVSAGQSLRLPPGEAVAERTARPAAAAAAVGQALRALAGERELPPGLSAEQLYLEHKKLAKEAQLLRQELEALRAERPAEREEEPKGKFYAPEPEELLKMAERCELRWDSIPFGAKPETVAPKMASELGLSGEEQALVNKVLAAEHARVIRQITELYVEVTGDPNTGSLSPMAMMHELEDKAPEGEIQRVFQRLSRERAKLPPLAVPAGPPTPWERLYRLLTTSGDTLEAALAQELGAEQAHALRDKRGGFGSRSRSTSGCPGTE